MKAIHFLIAFALLGNLMGAIVFGGIQILVANKQIKDLGNILPDPLVYPVVVTLFNTMVYIIILIFIRRPFSGRAAPKEQGAAVPWEP
jgi:hypothetical protein